MKFSIQDTLAKKFPKTTISIILAKNIKVEKNLPKLDTLRINILKDVFDKNKDLVFAEIPAVKTWRDIFREFGAKPSDYKSSIEALLKRVMKEEFPSINSIVDIYNLVSIQNGVPSAAYDLDHIKGNIQIRFANGTESFLPLGSDKQENPKEGEVVYTDDEKIICRRWNYRDCDQTKVTLDSKNIVFFIDGAAGFSESVKMATKQIQELLREYMGVESEATILSVESNHLSCELFV